MRSKCDWVPFDSDHCFRQSGKPVDAILDEIVISDSPDQDLPGKEVVAARDQQEKPDEAAEVAAADQEAAQDKKDVPGEVPQHSPLCSQRRLVF